MPLLRVRCTKCSRLISTGFDVDYDTFQALTDTERTVECPHCQLTQLWTLDGRNYLPPATGSFSIWAEIITALTPNS